VQQKKDLFLHLGQGGMWKQDTTLFKLTREQSSPILLKHGSKNNSSQMETICPIGDFLFFLFFFLGDRISPVIPDWP
jgi:hypothetical protein